MVPSTIIEQIREAGCKLTLDSLPSRSSDVEIIVVDPDKETIGLKSLSEKVGLVIVCFINDQRQIPTFDDSLPWCLAPAPQSLVFRAEKSGPLIVTRNDQGTFNACAEITIQSFIELQEVVEAFLSPQFPTEAAKVFQTVQLSTLVQEVYLPIHVQEKLRLVAWTDLRSLFPKIDFEQRAKDALYGLKHELDSADHEWFDRLSSLDPNARPFTQPNDTDLLIVEGESIGPARAYKAGLSGIFDFGIALRLTANASVLFMLDLLRNSFQGVELMRRFALSPSPHEWLRTTEISSPRKKSLQTHHSIALRHARQKYLNEVGKLSKGREPLELAGELFMKRREMVQSLHSEMIVQLESLVAPLPFFLEYPFGLFVGSADHLQRIRHAQLLLSIICKTMVFLPLEELECDRTLLDQSQQVASKLKERPLSDGAMLELSREVTVIASSRSTRDKISVFRLLSDANGMLAESIGPVIAARNRLHHAPYDEKGFLKAADAVFPDVIATLRNVLSGIVVILPKQVRPGRGKLNITALKVMGENPALRSVEFTSSIPAGHFVVDELAAYRPQSEALIPLHNWFTTRPVGRDSLDVGLFDRMYRNGPEYTFVAS